MKQASYFSELDPEEIIKGIEEWVLVESPTTDVKDVNKMMDLAEAAMAELEFATERIPGSDGNFTGVLGIPTLDGLGVCNDGFHTHYEHLLVSSIVPRTQLLMRLLKELR